LTPTISDQETAQLPQREKPQPAPFDLLAFPPQGDLSHYPNGVASILVGEFLIELPGVVEGQFKGLIGHGRLANPQ
jgi:hypothetical protein